MPKYVFALSPGRTGSTSFAEACAHFTNFTSAHESRNSRIGDNRFAYPENHIEADNRLTWHLGQLAAKYDGQDVLYVHLRRNPDKIAESYSKRWEDVKFRSSIMRAFANGIIMREGPWEKSRRLEVSKFYVDTVIANTEEFLKNRPHIDVSLEDNGVSFQEFMERIGAEGDLDSALRTWRTPANTHSDSITKAKKSLIVRIRQTLKTLINPY